MKRISLFVAGIIVAVIGLHAQAAIMVKVKVQVANIRVEPDMNSAIVKRVDLGTQLGARQKVGDWFELILTDERGATISAYIHSSVVDVVGAGEAKPEEQPRPQTKQQPVLQPAAQPTPPPAPAAEVKGIWPSIMIFGRYGSFSPSDETFKTIYGSGSVYGGEFRLRIASGFFVSLDGGAYKKTGALTLTQEETTMTLFPIDAMVVFHFLSGSILPYVGAGGAVCKYKEENVLGKVDKWGFGFAVCGGATARWRLLGIDARVKYTSIKIKPLEVEADLGGLTLSIGAGVVF